MRSPRIALALALAACGGVASTAPDAGTASDVAPAADAPAPGDAAPDAAAAACDISGFAFTPVATTRTTILPSDTAQGQEVIHDTLQGTLKRHVLVAPTNPAERNGLLFLWMSGSGAEPTSYDTIQAIAAAAGYPSISLAYDNETSVGDLCSVPGDPQCGLTTVDCEEGVREEMIYGSAVHDSPCVDVPPADAIEHRVLRLLQYLAINAPATGAAAFLTNNGTAIDWTKIAVGGWSQGGGHAGMIARDHLVARALYASKGASSVACPYTVSDPAMCDLDGDHQLTPGNQDELLVPAPWTLQPRATPGSREFGAIHREEEAFNYSRETFERFGMGTKGDEIDLDTAGADFAAYGCRHVFATSATPGCDPTAFHKSMAMDVCLARDANDLAILAPAYYYALKLPVPPVP
ncbi:MAG: hypothetical protein K8W52_34920 [Deltaproteobacteria bacterium]|nr:hypothetical protein [Deltaproteobacteria bacterium]